MISQNENPQNGDLTALKNQVFTLLVALIVLSGTFTVYLYRQVSLLNKDIAQTKQLSAQLTRNQQAIEVFVTQLVTYAERHPDYLPVLKKYGVVPPPAGAAAPKK
jgi:hypothetical protein